MSSSLVDLTIELLNEAKVCSDAKRKLYYLEQIKEIVLFRDVSILVGLIPDIEEFKIERSIRIRKWLIKFFSEAWTKSKQVFSQLLSLYSFYVLDDASDDIIRCIATEFKTVYSQVVAHIVKMPILQKQELDVKIMWNQIKSISDIIIDFITSSQADTTKVECIKFIESVIQYATPVVETSKTLDPRLKAKKTETVLSEVSSADIPLHHPFINRTDIETDASNLFATVILWIDDTHKFSATVISQLCQSVVAISLARTRYLSTAAIKVLTILEKMEICRNMPTQSKQELIRSVYKLRHNLAFQADTKALVAPYRVAVENLEKLVSGATTETDVLAVSLDDKEDDEVRATAKAALSIAESDIKSKSGLSADSDNRSAIKFSIIGETELTPCRDDMVPVDPRKNASTVIFGTACQINGILCLDAFPINADQFSSLTIASLYRILDDLQLTKSDETFQKYLNIAVNTVVSLAMLEYETVKPAVTIPIINSISAHSFAAKLNEGLPSNVSISSNILLLISNISSNFDDPKSKQRLIDLSSELMHNLHHRILIYNASTSSSSILRKLYDDLSLYIISKMIQHIKLRTHITTLLSTLPKINMKLLKFLNLLMHSGSKSVEDGESKAKSIRGESMRILFNVAFSASIGKASQLSLDFLLWATISDDFEIRSKVIASLVSNNLSLEGSKVDTLKRTELFSLCSFITLIGVNIVKERIALVSTEYSSASSRLLHIMDVIKFLETDNGSFGNRFTEVSESKFESKLKIYIHLFSQLCLVDSSLLTTYFDFYSCIILKLTRQGSSEYLKKESIETLFIDNLSTIVPILISRPDSIQTFQQVFDRSDSDVLPLIEKLVSLMSSDQTLPASPSIVTLIKSYLRRAFSSPVASKSESESQSDGHVIDGVDYSNADVRKIITMVVSGFSEVEINEILPVFVCHCQSNEISELFKRLTSCRPPVITKASLLIFLHRQHNVDQKFIVNAVDTLLLLDDWKHDIVKSSLMSLLHDSIVPSNIIRTAILFCQKEANVGELKDWLVSTFLTEIVTNKLYESQSVWEGVIYCINKYSTHKNIDKVLIPIIQDAAMSRIHELLKGSPSIKPIVENLANNLSSPRKELIIELINTGVVVGDPEESNVVPKKKKSKKSSE